MSTNYQKTTLLGDTPQRTYTTKLDLFNRFAEPELRLAIAGLGLRPNDTVLDAGCGAGLITAWLAEQVPGGLAVGLDLATAHIQHAARRPESGLPLTLAQGDMVDLPFEAASFDLVWSSNAINHLRHPVDGLKTIARFLKPGGRLALGQSAFLADMVFAWDARLEKEVTLAVRRYYRDKYNLDERDTAHVRNLLGWLKQAGLNQVTAQTIIIERAAPLSEADIVYFVEGVFKGYWGHRVQPYLSAEDWAELEQLCDPASPHFAPRRPDFHHLQTFTLVTGVT